MKSFEIFDSEDHVTEAAVAGSATSVIASRSVLMVTRSGILRHTFPVAISRVAVALNQDLKAIVPHTGLLPNFIAYALRAFGPTIINSCVKDGTTVQSIESSMLKRFRIPVAPHPEQARVVDTLDELFSELDAGIAALERARAKLKLYRASVLKAAVEGALTAEWRAQHPDAEPASELLKRILAERRHRWEAAQLKKFKQAGKPPPKNWKTKYKEPVAPDTSDLPPLPDGWCWTTVDQSIVSAIINGISVRGSDTPPGIASLRLSAMTDAGFNYAERRYLPLSPSDVDDLWIQSGDFFVCRGNGSKKLVGRGTLAQDPKELVIFPDTMMRLRVSPILQATGWISTIWSASIVRSQIERAAKTTAGIWKIAQPDLARIAVPLPSVPEQATIVEAIEEQLSAIDHLEADLDVKLKSAQALRQSILRDAFAGKLVPQDPNDEPARVLLERIAAARAQRATAGKGKPRRGKPGKATALRRARPDVRQ
jgi:type I restriction enzyme S subunit